MGIRGCYNDFSERSLKKKKKSINGVKRFTISIYLTKLKKAFRMWLVEGGRSQRTGNFWGRRDILLDSIPAVRWKSGPLGVLLHGVDVFLNPGIAGIGTDMPALFGEKAVEKAEV